MKKNNINESINYKFTLTNKVNSSNVIWKSDKNKTSLRVLIRLSVEDICEKICAIANNIYNDLDINNDIVIFDFFD